MTSLAQQGKPKTKMWNRHICGALFYGTDLHALIKFLKLVVVLCLVCNIESHERNLVVDGKIINTSQALVLFVLGAAY